MNKPLKCAVVGVGKFGCNHAEKYAQMDHCTLVAVVDTNAKAATDVAKKYSTTPLTDHRKLVGLVDAVSIVSETRTHYQIAHDLLSSGVHTLIEKPMTTTVADADKLIKLAEDNHCILQVGHIERFNPTLVQLDNIVLDNGYIQIERHSTLSQRNNDTCVILDLMIHDLDLVLSLVDSNISRINAKGLPVVSGDTDIANAYIEFENNCVANLSASRVSKNVKRNLRIFTKNGYFSIKLKENSSRHYWRDSNDGTIHSENQSFPEIDMLAEEIRHFIHCIDTDTQPIVDGHAGRQALDIAIQATAAITRNSVDY